jgi:LPS export ABC transporter protein LptC
VRLSRKQSILASVALLLLFFTSVVLLRPSSPALPSSNSVDPSAQTTLKPSSTPDDPETPAKGADFVLDNFKREEIKNGKKVWEVQATRGRYNPSAGKAALENANLWLYQEDGGVVNLKAEKVILKLDGPEGLSAADLIGNVIIVKDNKMTLECDQASYDKAKDLISAPNLVKISGENMTLQGIGMEVTVSTKIIKLLRQTETKLEPKPDSPSQATEELATKNKSEILKQK